MTLSVFLRCSLVIVLAPAISNASMITHQVFVQPYQVCYEVEGCADMTGILDGSWEAFADEIFGSAGLDIVMLAPLVLNTTPEGDIEDHLNRFDDEAGIPHFKIRTEAPLFVDFLFPPPGIVGLGWNGAGGMLVQTGAGGAVTFAHELGHNLGLQHYFESGIGRTKNIMDYGDCIVGDCDPLLPSQVAEIQGIIAFLPFAAEFSAVPEPNSLMLFGLGIIGFGIMYRRAEQA